MSSTSDLFNQPKFNITTGKSMQHPFIPCPFPHPLYNKLHTTTQPKHINHKYNKKTE